MDATKEYVVFKAVPKFKPIRLGSLGNLRMAIEIMNRMASRMPGEYFIVDLATDEVVASYPEGSITSQNKPQAAVRTNEPKFDIYLGRSGNNALWIEAVEGLSSARARMQKIATEQPGEYFVFSSRDHAILATVDTLGKPQVMQDNQARSDVA